MTRERGTTDSAALHIAIITRGYPPLQHVSATRPYFLSRELAARGHAVSVICMDWRREGQSGSDAGPGGTGNDADPGGVRVHRVAVERGDRMTATGTSGASFVRHSARKAMTAARLLGWGPHPGWGRASSRVLRDLHTEVPIDVVWAIHGDATSHEIASRFSLASGVPWVADFKDPWDLYVSGVMARRLARHATARRLRTAASVTETSAEQCALDQECFGGEGHVVMSGYDAGAMANATPVPSEADFVIGYFGTVNAQHDAALFGRGLRRLRERYPELAGRVQVRIFSASADALRDAVVTAQSGGTLRLEQPVAQRDAFRQMRSCDLLLLLPNRSTNVGVKELEYLASGTPVLSVGAVRGEVRALVPAMVQLFEATDETMMADFIAGQMLEPPRIRRGEVNSPQIARFGWEVQAELLERVLLLTQRGIPGARPHAEPARLDTPRIDQAS